MSAPISILHANQIELHYWFNDETHSMNAIVFHKCGNDFLCIANELANKLNINVEIEILPLENGGLRSVFKFISNDKLDLKKAIIIFILTSVAFTPITTTIDEITRRSIEYFFESPEIKELKAETMKTQLHYDKAKLKYNLMQLSDSIDEYLIKKKKSNYFESLRAYSKIKEVSVSITDDKKHVIHEHKIARESFDEYIMDSDDLEPEVNESAVIEIVSPVLKKGKYKWVGIYNGQVIQFNMKSNEFKTLVQTGKIEFKNGTSINCNLITYQKISTEGAIKITGYDVTMVNEYFYNNTPIETPEGRIKRQKKEAEKQQLHLFE